jgi:Fe-S cluster assembly protein SufD
MSLSPNKTYKESFAALPEWGAGIDPWYAGLRRRAFERFQKLSFPTPKHESWRYIGLDPILGSSYRVEDGGSKAVFSAQEAGKSLLDFETLWREDPDFLKSHLGSGIEEEDNPFVLVNTFSFRNAVALRLPDHLTLEKPIRLLWKYKGSASGDLHTPRLLITAGKCVRAKIIVDFEDTGGGRIFSNAVSEVYAGEGACLDFFQIQRQTRESVQFLTNRFYLKSYATLNALSFTRGGAVTRNESSVRFTGEGGFCSLKGLAVLREESQVFNHTAAHHDVPHCASRQFYKTVLGGNAKSEFNSVVSVAKNARKSDSNQMNRNLLLSDTAVSHSRPQLLIDNDDVICVHGSATGPMEDDELFYLRSRGLGEKEARILVTYGFAREVLEEIMDTELREKIDAEVRGDLKEMVKE